jgi:hypothetical protein
VESKKVRMRRVKYWEIIADNLHKAGWSLGWVSAIDVQGRTIWIVDAYGYGKRFIVRAPGKAGCIHGTATGDTRVRGEFDVVVPAQKRGCACQATPYTFLS